MTESQPPPLGSQPMADASRPEGSRKKRAGRPEPGHPPPPPPPPPPGSEPPPPSAPAGWIRDPDDPAKIRYWDGSAWTDNWAANPDKPTPWDQPAAPLSVAPVVAGNAPTVNYAVVDGWLVLNSSTVPYLPAGTVAYLTVSGDGSLSVRETAPKVVANYRLVKTYKASEWQFVSSETVPVRERKTPTWAIILGVIGIFVFLIGIVFFFVKETKTVMKPGLTISTRDGQFSGHREFWKPPPVV